MPGNGKENRLNRIKEYFSAIDENRFAVIKNSDSGDGTVELLRDEFRKELVSLFKSRPFIPLYKFRAIYEAHFGKTFNLEEHGYVIHGYRFSKISWLKDLFMTLPDIITVYQSENNTTYLKRKPNYAEETATVKSPEVSQSPQGSEAANDRKEQMERLDTLKKELTVLLQSQPEGSIPMKDLFGKYFFHFRKKLHSGIKGAGYKRPGDLFEAMSQTVQVLGSGPETLIKLSEVGNVMNETQTSQTSVMQKPKCGPAMLHVNKLGVSQESKSKEAVWAEGRAFFRKELTQILESQPEHSITIGQFRDIFKERFGKQIFINFPGKYGCAGLPLLIRTMPETALIVGSGREAMIELCTGPGYREVQKEDYVKWRQNQIDLFKDTDDYRRYLEAVPKEQRRPDMPQTPDIHDGITNGAMSRWKKSIRSFVKGSQIIAKDTVEAAKLENADPPIKLQDHLASTKPNESAKAMCPSSTKDKLKHKLHLILFSVELVELLKSRPMCFIRMSAFGNCFEQHFGKKFNVKDYGYSKLEPIFESLPAIVRIADEEGRIGITLDDSYAEEMQHKDESTRQFAKECTKIFPTCSEMLTNMPDYEITLANFPEKYFQHFGRLRRPLSDLGFRDLLEWFEAMPDTVGVIGSEGCPVQLKTELMVLSNVELPMMQNDTPDPEDVADVEDEEEENETDAEKGGGEDNENVKGAFERLGLMPVKPLGSLSRGVTKIVGLFTKKQ